MLTLLDRAEIDLGLSGGRCPAGFGRGANIQFQVHFDSPDDE
jgi:hypothetical protein